MANFTRCAHICRVDEMNNFVRRVAIQFAEPLPFKPGEQDYSKIESDANQELDTLKI